MTNSSITLLGIAAVTALATAAVAAPDSTSRQPNVLFIAVDDLNDWIEPLAGHRQTKTPNLSRLAKRSVLFTNAHCAAPACHPSRVAVMTGVHPASSGIYNNVFPDREGPLWREESPLLADAVTLSQFFRNAGYRAVGGGKIYHALQWWPGSLNDPDTWDEYYPAAHRPIPPWVRPKLTTDEEQGISPGRPLGDRQRFGAAPLDVPDRETSDYQVVDWATQQLDREHDKPFFLACGIFRPHIPWEVPRSYFEAHPLKKVCLPEHQENDLADAFSHGRAWWHEWVTRNDLWDDLVQGYLASITYSDAQIGRLLDALEASDHHENTIVVLWSDHGMHIGEKENWEKFTLWEESTRVPLLISAPGVSEGGGRCDQPVSLIDIYPTLAELGDLEVPPQCEGESLVPQLKDPTADRQRPAVTSFAFHRPAGPIVGHAVRTDRWRYIHYSNGFEELYDHQSDPQEYTNLAGAFDYGKTIRELRQFLPSKVAVPK